jgi:hypothetical protein
MRYTYEIHDRTGKRKDICTRIEEVFAQLNDTDAMWIVYITDNMTHKVCHVARDRLDLEEWYETACRTSQWSDAETKGIIRKVITEKGCPVCKQSWDPFNEKETGIHMHTEGLHAVTSKEAAYKLADKNLKTAAAAGKPTFQAIPMVALVALGKAMQNGEDKYERYNWREAGSTSSVFFNAMLRHLIDWYCGEDYASDSKVHHLAHLMAGCAIILDTELHGKLNDDRDKAHTKLLDDMVKLIHSQV